MPSTEYRPHKPRPAIDWPAVHQRLAQAQDALARDFEPPPEQWQRVLQQRAIALAQVLPTPTDLSPPLDVLCFRLGEERYALATRHLAEVHAIRELSPLPCVPAFIAGLINLRGQVLSVVDLRALLQLPRPAEPPPQHAIVLQGEDMLFAVLADRIDGIRQLAGTELRPPPALLRERGPDYLRGISETGWQLLDDERLLNDPALRVDQEVAA